MQPSDRYEHKHSTTTELHAELQPLGILAAVEFDPNLELTMDGYVDELFDELGLSSSDEKLTEEQMERLFEKVEEMNRPTPEQEQWVAAASVEDESAEPVLSEGVEERMLAASVAIKIRGPEIAAAGGDVDARMAQVVFYAEDLVQRGLQPADAREAEALAEARLELSNTIATQAVSSDHCCAKAAARLRQQSNAQRWHVSVSPIVLPTPAVVKTPNGGRPAGARQARQRGARAPSDEPSGSDEDPPPQQPPSACLVAALEYRQHGFTVLPLRGKKPDSGLIRKTHGSTSQKAILARTQTEADLRTWFSRPGVNVGVFCGEPSQGLVVVDLDECDFPPAGYHLPLTPLVKTGRDSLRGYHLYYHAHSETSKFKLADGFGEVRGRTPLYVVAPPSVHPRTKRRYEWQLPLDELPLADFGEVTVPRAEDSARVVSPTPQLRPTEAVLLGPCTTRDSQDEKWLECYDRDPAAVEAMAGALGIGVPLGRPFHCVLHPEQTASAALYQAAETGTWLYHDFHASRHGDPEWLNLAQVRALQAGRRLPLTPSELATWKLILLVDAGLLPLAPVPAPQLPPDSAGVVQHVYERFLFLLGCRWNYTHGAAAPFTREFAAALCSISVRAAREAIDELSNAGHICVADHHDRTRLWLPAAGTAASSRPQQPQAEMGGKR